MVKVEVEKSKIHMEIKGSKLELMVELGSLIGHFLDEVSDTKERERDKAILCGLIHECL